MKNLYFHLDGVEIWSRKEIEATIKNAALHAKKFEVVWSADEADAVILLNSEHISSPEFLIKKFPSKSIFCWDDADHPTGIMNGLYCSMSRPAFSKIKHDNFSYPILYNEQIIPTPQEDAEHLVSFFGGITSPIRRKIVSSLERQTGAQVMVRGGPWAVMFDRSGVQEKIEYFNALRRSKFFVCPKGNGVGSIRLFETMKAGRVPVIISDRFALPTRVDWERCSILVPERDIGNIVSLCRANEARWPEMARAAREEYERHFGETGLIDSIGERLSNLAPSTASKLLPRAYWALTSERFLKRRFLDARRAILPLKARFMR